VDTTYSDPSRWVNGDRIPNPDYIYGLQRTRLIQRLGPPRPVEDGVQLIQSDAWLGIGTYMGMNDLMRQIFNSLCTLDYMGATEYEWGVVPKAFRSVCERSQKSELVAFEYIAIGAPISNSCWGSLERDFEKLTWFQTLSREQKTRVMQAYERSWEKGKEEMFCEVSLYAISPQQYVPHVLQVMSVLSEKDGDRSLCEPSQLHKTIFLPWDFREEYGFRSIGWFDIENDFLFFSDKDVWLKWLRVLGITPPQETRDKKLGSALDVLQEFSILP